MNPIYKKYVPLGENNGMSIALWEKNLQLQRQEKLANKWETKQEINLSPSVMKELLWIMPKAIETIENSRKEKN